uniref:Uncharacterized protein n=1 Tax=Siphoviridae sp. ctbIK24 TaxID=2827899 RepID=A0A8S5TPG9_9CAUD|nr:MAG TPA: hypothetical protein [Siphoviridae sp. ctbIK24]
MIGQDDKVCQYVILILFAFCRPVRRITKPVTSSS